MPATGRTRRAPAGPRGGLGLDDRDTLDDLGVPDAPDVSGTPGAPGAADDPGGAVPARRPRQGAHSLPYHHRWIELARAGEYTRTGLIGPQTEKRIRQAVLALPLVAADGAAGGAKGDAAGATAAVAPDPLSALEACVRSRLPDDVRVRYDAPVRDDVRACAWLMRGRERLLETVTALSRLSRASLEAAARHTGSVMPGCPRRGNRPAQAMTFGFYLAALAEATAGAAESLQASFDAVNLCPLGAGVMTGLEAPLDRHRLAVALGFDGPQPHALTSAVSGAWVLRSAAELSVLATTLNRFLNDLIRWAGPGLRFIGPPDAPAGPSHTGSSPAGSSTGPHAPGAPVLERTRDLARHLTGLSYEIVAAQGDLGHTDPEGIGGEGGEAAEELFTTCGTMLALFERVVTDVRFHPEPASRAVRDEPAAVSAVTGHLVLEHGVPEGTARAVVDAWSASAGALSAAGLVAAGERFGLALDVGQDEVRELLDPEAGVRRKRTAGSTGPEHVLLLLEQVGDRLAAVDRGSAQRSGWLREAWDHTVGTGAGGTS
ncbi:lyase family protein [Streptosporangium sp. DT93]|uniref:lyase family protein n=1 Tax=Streptosporangium sp. DT93 TaxID=3393428 RepID=UPI003CF412F5